MAWLTPAPRHAWVINLDHRPDRFLAVQRQAQANGVQVERHSACNPSKGDVVPLSDVVTQWDTTLNARFDRTYKPHTILSMSRGERGCAMSHLQLWRKMIAQHLPVAMVFEDDVALAPLFSALLDRYYAALPLGWDIFYLEYANGFPATKVLDDPLLYKGAYVWHTGAYVMSLKGALTCVQNLPIDGPVDNFLARLTHAGLLQAYLPFPALAQQVGADSDIEHSHTHAPPMERALSLPADFTSHHHTARSYEAASAGHVGPFMIHGSSLAHASAPRLGSFFSSDFSPSPFTGAITSGAAFPPGDVLAAGPSGYFPPTSTPAPAAPSGFTPAAPLGDMSTTGLGGSSAALFSGSPFTGGLGGAPLAVFGGSPFPTSPPPSLPTPRTPLSYDAGTAFTFTSPFSPPLSPTAPHAVPPASGSSTLLAALSGSMPGGLDVTYSFPTGALPLNVTFPLEYGSAPTFPPVTPPRALSMAPHIEGPALRSGPMVSYSFPGDTFAAIPTPLSPPRASGPLPLSQAGMTVTYHQTPVPPPPSPMGPLTPVSPYAAAFRSTMPGSPLPDAPFPLPLPLPVGPR